MVSEGFYCKFYRSESPSNFIYFIPFQRKYFFSNQIYPFIPRRNYTFSLSVFFYSFPRFIKRYLLAHFRKWSFIFFPKLELCFFRIRRVIPQDKMLLWIILM